MKKRMAKMRCSALICPVGLYEEPVLIYLFDDTHICILCLQNIPKFPLRWILFIYKIEVFLLKM